MADFNDRQGSSQWVGCSCIIFGPTAELWWLRGDFFASSDLFVCPLQHVSVDADRLEREKAYLATSYDHIQQQMEALQQGKHRKKEFGAYSRDC